MLASSISRFPAFVIFSAFFSAVLSFFAPLRSSAARSCLIFRTSAWYA